MGIVGASGVVTGANGVNSEAVAICVIARNSECPATVNDTGAYGPGGTCGGIPDQDPEG